MTASCQLSDLGPLGDHIGDGKQGDIYTLKRNLSLVFKRYKDTGHVNEYLLSELIDWPGKLHSIERSLILTSTAWPRMLVRERGTVIGITMLRAPERFTYLQPKGKRELTDLSAAITLDRPHVRVHIPVPNDRERLLLAYRLCRFLVLFERDGLLFTDLSANNLLWTLNPQPGIFLLDCDSALFKDRLNPSRAARTANWFDPWFGNKPTSEEVRGLFTLIFARLVFARQYPNEKSHLVLPPAHPFAKHFQDLVTSGFSENLSGRPSMSRWQEQIEELLSQIKPRQEPAAAASVSIPFKFIKPTTADNPKEPEEGRLIYRSNFYLPDDRWPEEESFCDYFRQDGYYHMRVRSYGFGYRKIEIPITDFRVYVDAEFITSSNEADRYVIKFRHDSNMSGYDFSISRSGCYSLSVQNNGTWRAIIDSRFSDLIRRGNSPNSLMVEMAGQKITLGVNGQILDTAMDTTLKSGFVGLYISTSEDASVKEARFRDFRLYSLE